MAAQMGGGEGQDVTQSVIRPLISNISFFFVIILPMLSMRQFAEEKKQGTYELLMTSPISITQMVVGKFLGVLAMVVLILLLLALYPLLLMAFGAHLDPGTDFDGISRSTFDGRRICGLLSLCIRDHKEPDHRCYAQFCLFHRVLDHQLDDPKRGVVWKAGAICFDLSAL